MQQRLVSVLMPVRSWRVTSTEAINSILNQSHRHLELLLIGQRDLQPLIDELQAADIQDTRIRLVARDSAGIVGALNTGLAHAHGEYIARMDDDDVAYPERLATQLAFLDEHPDVQLCGTRIRMVDVRGELTGVASGNLRYAAWLNQLVDADEIAHACFAENPLPHPTLLAHHNTWKQLNGYHDVAGPEDHDLVLRAKLAGMRMGKPEQVLLDWREHPDRLTHTDSRYTRQAFIAQSARALAQQLSAHIGKAAPAVWIAGTGKHARHWHDELQDNGICVNGFIDMHRPGTQRCKRSLPVITYDRLASLRTDELMVSAVTQPSARRAVYEFFTDQDWHEGVDFIVGG